MIHLIDRFADHLKTGKYNSNTVQAYRNAVFVFYNHFRDHPETKFEEYEIIDYINELKAKNPQTDTSTVVRALRMFFDVIFNKQFKLSTSEKAKDESQIDIFNQAELSELFSGVKNPKHRLLLKIVYAHGLKINEVIELSNKDIDTAGGYLVIRHSNTKKNRKIRLAQSLYEEIEEYRARYQPDQFFFAGSGGDKKYTARNIQLFFQKAIQESSLSKNATLNTLRHSYAVHLLEMGTDIHIVKELLGHNNLQTTSLYLQFAEVQAKQVLSPLDFEFRIVL
jgi:integrase/recombinase XerD